MERLERTILDDAPLDLFRIADADGVIDVRAERWDPRKAGGFIKSHRRKLAISRLQLEQGIPQFVGLFFQSSQEGSSDTRTTRR